MQADTLYPNRKGRTGRPLRYRPVDGWFVIDQGGESFNRPLYGRGSGFRIDTGDRPEYLLYLPGRGGNLRLGCFTPHEAFWFLDAAGVTAAYRPGRMRHVIRDPRLGTGSVTLEAVSLLATDGLVVRIDGQGLPQETRLLWAFGGVTGIRGNRDGDLGTEAVPVSEYFQLTPDHCLSDSSTFQDRRFTVQGPGGTLSGIAPQGSTLRAGAAQHWNHCHELFTQPGTSPGLLLGEASFNEPLFLGLQRTDPSGAVFVDELPDYKAVTSDREGRLRGPQRVTLAPPWEPAEWPTAFDDAVATHEATSTRVTIKTPDPYLDLAVTALQGGVEGVWDEDRGLVLHGAVAWRAALLGWRGAYALDALGYHDRARRHLGHWAARQNPAPVTEEPVAPDEPALARCERALHSNGDLSHSHYDMNLVWADTLVRHLRWTGDLETARRFWPTFERHLAWERRLFRRSFGPEGLPLYEAYAAIWASDHLHYAGGGTALASAYNRFHHSQAARWAGLLGQDPAPFQAEADLIDRALRTHLWMPDRRCFAEAKDWLGLQLVHPHAGLWTFYHLIDSEVPTPEEAEGMVRDLGRLRPLPIEGPGVPEGRWSVLPTTDWMPYAWSVNNVCLNENAHTALGLWQAGQPDRAYEHLGGAILASLYQGLCPGNVGTMNHLDVYRRESQRDFADGAGVLARAVVEGLFGVGPDLLAGELTVRPGFPADWDHARLCHPDLDLAWSRHGDHEELQITNRFGRPLKLRIVGRGPDREFQLDQRLTIDLSPARPSPSTTEGPLLETPPEGWRGLDGLTGACHPVDLGTVLRHSLTELFEQEYRSPRSPFCSLALPLQGTGGWAGGIDTRLTIDDRGLRGRVRDGDLTLGHFVFRSVAHGPNTAFVSRWDNFPTEITVPLIGRADGLVLLMAGTTHPMHSRLDNGEVIVTYADGAHARLALRNPETWWPVEEDYFVDDYQFRLDGPLPARVDLATGEFRRLHPATFPGTGRPIAGGAATVLGLALDSGRPLARLTVRALANEVVLGLLAASLLIPKETP